MSAALIASTDNPPVCQSPDLQPRRPALAVPPGAWDCHAHVFGDPARYPLPEKRRYTPSPAGLEEYRAMLAALGLEHAVVVQPTLYPDNQVTIDALLASNGKWRGIGLLKASVPDAEIERLHGIGFRGVRFHPRHGNTHALDDLEPLCERMKAFGWHAQFHLDARDLAELGPRLLKLPVPFVIDHLGHMAPAAQASLDHPGFQFLLRALESGRGWVKLSAPNRFGDPKPPYPSVLPFARALVQANPEQALWATDWPHSSHPGYMPNDAELLDLLSLWAPEPAVQHKILVDNPMRLYR
jgi:predicted TIM-barrel fold metal-dependent hydrolase